MQLLKQNDIKTRKKNNKLHLINFLVDAQFLLLYQINNRLGILLYFFFGFLKNLSYTIPVHNFRIF